VSPIIYIPISVLAFVVFFVALMKSNKGSDGFWPFVLAFAAASVWPLSIAFLAISSSFVLVIAGTVKLYYLAFPDDETGGAS
jgi:hypothetical protein